MRPSPILALFLLAPLLASPALGAPADDPRPIVQASEILAKIERGEPVEYDGVIVEGDLDLSGLDLQTKQVERTWDEIVYLGLTEEVKLVESSISIRDSEIRGDVNLGNSIFQEPVNFEGTNFTEEAWFPGANFSGSASFWKANFSDYANFGWAKFSGFANFGWANFSDYANFGWAVFSGSAGFSSAVFNGSANFCWANFSGYAEFREVEFHGDADFGYARFSGSANFRWAVFSSSASFSSAVFSGSDADFGRAVFSGVLYLSGLDFTRLYIDWRSIESPVCDGVTYSKLVKNFKELEQFEDADRCYYDYRKWRQGRKNWFYWSKYIDVLALLTCGYGVRPGYTLAWSFVLIPLFGIAFWAGNGIYKITAPHHINAHENGGREWSVSSVCCMPFNKILNMLGRMVATSKILRRKLGTLLKTRPSTLRQLPGRIWNASFVTDLSFKDALYFSMMVFVSQPPHDWRPKEGWKYAVMLEDVLGWLLLALFLVTLGNVMIR